MSTLTSSQTTRLYLILGVILEDKNWTHYREPSEQEWFRTFKAIVNEWLVANDESDRLAEVLATEDVERFQPQNILVLEREMRIIYKSAHDATAAKMTLLGRLLEEIEAEWYVPPPVKIPGLREDVS